MSFRRRLAEMRERGSDGFTLVELLIASAMMVIIVTALVAALALALRTSVGLSATPAPGAGQDKTLIAAQVESHIAIQDLTRYFTGDVENANNPTDVKLMSNAAVACARPLGDPTLGTSSEVNLVQVNLPDSSGAVTEHATYVYSTDGLHAEITRYDCALGSGTATALIAARGLSSTVAPQAVQVSPPANQNWVLFELQVTTVSGRLYKIDANPAVNVSAPAGPGGSGGVTPPAPFSTILMQDSNRDGFVDRVLVKYDSSTTIDSSCSQGWQLGGSIPSGGTYAGATVDNVAKTVTLGITPPSSGGTPDTSTGTLTVKFDPQASCKLLSFSQISPFDDARPILMSVQDGTGATDGNGRMDPGDSLSLTFSEALAPATVPTTANVNETAPSSGDVTLSIKGTTSGGTLSGLDLTPSTPVDTGAAPPSYLASKNLSATYQQATVSLNAAGNVITVKLPPLATSCTPTLSDCTQLTQGSGSFTFTPSPTLQAASDPNATTSTALTPTVLGTNPAPSGTFRIF